MQHDTAPEWVYGCAVCLRAHALVHTHTHIHPHNTRSHIQTDTYHLTHVLTQTTSERFSRAFLTIESVFGGPAAFSFWSIASQYAQ